MKFIIFLILILSCLLWMNNKPVKHLEFQTVNNSDSIYNSIPLSERIRLYNKIGEESPKFYIVEEYLKEQKCLHQ